MARGWTLRKMVEILFVLLEISYVLISKICAWKCRALSKNRSKRGMEARANAPRQFQCHDQHQMDHAITYAAIATGIS